MTTIRSGRPMALPTAVVSQAPTPASAPASPPASFRLSTALIRVSALALALALAPAPATAQVGAAGTAALDPAVAAAAERHTPEAIAFRHVIHQNPELGNREHETAALVAEHLRGLGFGEVRTGVAHTGVVGVLRGGRPGPVVAVRADMDALPVTEATGLPFASTKRTTYGGQEVGVMHACGHE